VNILRCSLSGVTRLGFDNRGPFTGYPPCQLHLWGITMGYTRIIAELYFKSSDVLVAITIVKSGRVP
jgi:hypothetical protein